MASVSRSVLLRGAGVATSSSTRRLFLGLDSSTQGIKATVVDEGLRVVAAQAVNYERDLAHYGTTNGVLRGPGGEVTQPPAMWIEGLERVLDALQKDGFRFEDIYAVSGSGQQHGSAFWRRGASAALAGLRAGRPLHEQLQGSFAVERSPIWMDSSTREECERLEEACGGAQALASISGSRAYERFTGNQIAKIARTQPAALEGCERISLVSSAMASVLAGKYAPIDLSDGSGMNLLDIHAKDWSEALLLATAPRVPLRSLLGTPLPSHACFANIHPYFVERFGFHPECALATWSGDNPCSVAGLRLDRPGDVAVSLGTSDTMFGIMREQKPGCEGHVFVNPVDPSSFMGMLCYKNGSLTRERVRDRVAGGAWDAFNRALASTVPGNRGVLGFFIDEPEITPDIRVTGTRFFGADGRRIAAPGPEVQVRAVVESQFLSMRSHGDSVGISGVRRVIATGGASKNPAILQVLADVFGVPVFVAAQSDSASLGAAFRALHAYKCACAGPDRLLPFSSIFEGAADGEAFRLASEPRADAHEAYTALLPHFRACEAHVLAEGRA